jgi:hypothetical protein
MMDRKTKLRKIQLYGTLSLSFLAIFVAIIAFAGGHTGSIFGWFTANRQVSGSVGEIGAQGLDTVSGTKVYPYYKLGTSYQEGVMTFSDTETTTKSLGKYSILTPKENGVLLEIDLTDYAQSVTALSLGAHSEASCYLGELDSANKLKQPLALKGNSLSSIICFYAFLPAAVSDNGTYFTINAADTINPASAKMNFVSNNALNAEFVINSITTKPAKIYLAIDYDATLIEDIYSANIGNDVINDITNVDESGQSYLSYDNDFYFTVQVTEG